MHVGFSCKETVLTQCQMQLFIIIKKQFVTLPVATCFDLASHFQANLVKHSDEKIENFMKYKMTFLLFITRLKWI
jgi:hypothetical protein